MTATGFKADTGAFTCGSQSEAEVKKRVIEKATTVIMLIDSSKVNKNTPYTFATLSDINYMVVDNNFPDHIKKKIKDDGINIL